MTNDLRLIHTQGLDEGIRCAMCTNTMKSDKGCDGGCVVDQKMYEKVLKVIDKALETTCIEDYPTCTECEHYDSEKHYCPRFCQVIKDALAEAQPCEDCISREAVRKILGNEVFELMKLHTVNPEDNPKADAMSYGVNWSLNTLMELPSVTPQRPKGKWIKIQSGDEDFPESIVCSQCKNENSHLDFDEHSEPIGKVFVTSKYCPNCGAEMSGGGEG